MIDLTVHKRFRYLLFSSLYFSEGLYQAVILIVTPIYLLNKNVPLPLITLIMGSIYPLTATLTQSRETPQITTL